MNKIVLGIALLLILNSCSKKISTDQLFYNGKIYTVDSSFTVVNALVIDSGKIVFAGDVTEARKKYSFKTETDLIQKFVYPGFIDPHSHFYGYGLTLNRVDLTGTISWNQIIKKVKLFGISHQNGWIQGRGWDQNDWDEKSFPTNDELNKLFPNQPVFLKRIDGHAAIANNKALELAGITAETKINGGKILLTYGKPTGVLIDNAMDLVEKIIPSPSEDEKKAALLAAQKKCFAVGLTTITDAGQEKNIIDLIDSMQQQNELLIRVYAMLTDNQENQDYYFIHGTYQTSHLHICSFKYYADGALGSRGACLLQPYNDDPSNYGMMLHPLDYYQKQAALCAANGFQMNTHCIGDSANRFMLHVYAQALQQKNNNRWRIEHCQVINENDFHFFSEYNIIPSIQPCFATSDMYWAKDRIGEQRLSNAYAWQKLLSASGVVVDGSDFPVENINPLFGFYAAVARKDQKGFPENGFQPQDSLTRKQALYAMTEWAAYACFEENVKGSLAPGKFADFVILENDIMTEPINKIFNTRVLETFVDGNAVFVSQ